MINFASKTVRNSRTIARAIFKIGAIPAKSEIFEGNIGTPSHVL
jgi:hypothetical protein